MKNIYGLVAVLFIAPAALISCKQEAKPVPVSQKLCVSDSMQNMITLDTAHVTHINTQLTLSGEVGFNEDKVVKIYPFSSGQVTEVKVSVGDKVTKGQTLAIIHSADVAGNYNDLKLAGSDIQIAKREYDNAKALYDRGINSEKELAIAKANYEKARTAGSKINEMLAINGGGHTTANGMYTITAPASGYIVEKNITAGGYIRSDNANSLFTISDLNEVWIWANVFEADIAKIREGYNAQITTIAYPGKVFDAKIDKISEMLDPQEKVMRIRLHLPNPNALLKPEMFTTVTIMHTESDQMVSVPTGAVLFENGKKFVVIYHDGCHLEVKEVSVMKSSGPLAYIQSGLSAGDVVISRNQLLFFRALNEQ